MLFDESCTCVESNVNEILRRNSAMGASYSVIRINKSYTYFVGSRQRHQFAVMVCHFTYHNMDLSAFDILSKVTFSSLGLYHTLNDYLSQSDYSVICHFIK